MLILIPIAFLAGLVTIFAPCILPILPVVFSAGVTGGKQRPLGIALGLVVSFTFFTLAISWLTRSVGISSNVLRDFAIGILLLFGLALLIPKLNLILESGLARLVPQVKTNSYRKDFIGGILIGLSLGLVWTPCVGPIIATVIALAATSSVSLTSVLIILAYGLGTSIPLLIIIYSGQNAMQRLKETRKNAPALQKIFGAIIVLTAIAMMFGLDQTAEASLLAKLPSSISSGLTQHLEESGTVQSQLSSLRGAKATDVPSSTQVVGGASSGLPVLGIAPDLSGGTNWLNSSALTIAQLKSKVVLVDFWTYSCINCLRSLPHVINWYSTYKDQGLVVIGVHTPEFDFEKDTGNVAAALKRLGVEYPVVQDNNYGIWNAFGNQYWPAEYLIDTNGKVREANFGEGNYDETERNIRSLLEEAKLASALPTKTSGVPDTTPTENQSPETYLGTDRQSNYDAGVSPSSLAVDHWTLSGSWNIGTTNIVSGKTGDSLSYNFTGQDMYLVLNPPTGGSGTVQVLVDGKQLDEDGTDVKNGSVTVDSSRLYHLAHLPQVDGGHTVMIIFQTPGTQAFSFTFG